MLSYSIQFYSMMFRFTSTKNANNLGKETSRYEIESKMRHCRVAAMIVTTMLDFKARRKAGKVAETRYFVTVANLAIFLL